MFEIGNTLREARLRRGLDVADCEAATKIRGKYLRALEEEQFEVLPGATYVKGFLRTYAEFLELDGRLVLDEYESRFTGRPEHHSDPEQVRRRAKRRRGREGRVLAIATCIVMLVSMGLWVGFADDPPAPPDTGVDLRFTATGTRETYLEVREGNAEGRALFTPGPLGAGRTRDVKTTPPTWVHFGDGPGILVSVDGRSVVTPSGRRDFIITAGGAVLPVER